MGEQCKLCDAAPKFLNTVSARLGWSGSGIHHYLKVVPTIAYLAGAAKVQIKHVAEAVQFFRGLKLIKGQQRAVKGQGDKPAFVGWCAA